MGKGSSRKQRVKRAAEGEGGCTSQRRAALHDCVLP